MDNNYLIAVVICFALFGFAIFLVLYAAYRYDVNKKQARSQAIADAGKATPSLRQIYCKYCGKQVPSDSVYCKWCGKKITEPSPVKSGSGFLLWDSEEDMKEFTDEWYRMTLPMRDKK